MELKFSKLGRRITIEGKRIPRSLIKSLEQAGYTVFIRVI